MAIMVPIDCGNERWWWMMVKMKDDCNDGEWRRMIIDNGDNKWWLTNTMDDWIIWGKMVMMDDEELQKNVMIDDANVNDGWCW